MRNPGVSGHEILPSGAGMQIASPEKWSSRVPVASGADAVVQRGGGAAGIEGVLAAVSVISHSVPTTLGNPASWNTVARWMASSTSPCHHPLTFFPPPLLVTTCLPAGQIPVCRWDAQRLGERGFLSRRSQMIRLSV